MGCLGVFFHVIRPSVICGDTELVECLVTCLCPEIIVSESGVEIVESSADCLLLTFLLALVMGNDWTTFDVYG
jgi:hypothetical protein